MQRGERVVPQSATRLLLIYAQPHTGAALSFHLAQMPHIRVQHVAGSPTNLLQHAQAQCADIVLIDWAMCRGCGVEMLTALHRLAPRPTLLVLSTHPEMEQTVLRAGADAFINQSYPPDALITILRMLAVSLARS